MNKNGDGPRINADGKEPQINADKRGSETPHTLARHGTVTREVTQRLIGAYYEVYNELGFGFLENSYPEAMAIELKQAEFRVDRELPARFERRTRLRLQRRRQADF